MSGPRKDAKRRWQTGILSANCAKVAAPLSRAPTMNASGCASLLGGLPLSARWVHRSLVTASGCAGFRIYIGYRV